MTGFLDRAAEGWWGWIAPLAVQAGILVLLVAAADAILRRGRAWPRVRMALWWTAALRLALPPTLTSPFSLTAPLLGSATGAAAAAGPATAIAPPSAPVALLLLWGLGVLATVVRDALAAGRARRRYLDPVALRPVPPRVRDALAGAAATLGLRRVPPIVVTAAVDGPAVLGILRPVILLPPSAAGLPGEDLRHVLLHEAAHVLRRDPLARAAFGALRAIHWYHPAAWLVAARAGALREACCDGTVAAALGEETGAYRRTLLRAARELVAVPGVRRVPAVAWIGGGDGIVDRLRALEGEPWRSPRLRGAVAGGLAGVLAVSVLPMAPGCAADVPAAARSAEVPGPDPVHLEEARAVLRRAAAGEEKESCVRIRYAAMTLTWAEGLSAPTNPLEGGKR